MASRSAWAWRGADLVSSVAVWGARAGALTLLGVPILLVIWLSLGADAYVIIPPTGYSLRWYRNVFAQGEFGVAFLVSLRIASVATPLALAIGTTAALGLWKYRVRGASALQAMLFAPLLVPQVVTGIALLYLFTRIGFYRSYWNIVIAHTIFATPFVVRTVGVALSRYDVALDEAAASLGARRGRVFWEVTLPLIRPGLVAGGLFAFALSFDDFTLAILLIGTGTRTLPVAIYQYLEWNVDATVSAVSGLLVLLAVVIAVALERLVGLERILGLRG